NLLFFESSRRTKLKLDAPPPDVLYEGLVLRDKSFTFGVPIGVDIGVAELDDETGTGIARERRGDIAVDYGVSSAKDVVSLQQKLFRLRSDANTILNEQGINTLHVALGFLRWRESDDSSDW